MKTMLVEKYYDLLRDKESLINEMKLYIINNYTKVDFSNFYGEIRSKADDKQSFFNPEKISFFEKYFLDVKKVETITDVVLDEIDFDLSITINDETYLWLTDESVVFLFDYIFSKKNN